MGALPTPTRQHDEEQDMTNASARSAWRAVPTSGFKVSGPDGSVPLIQIDQSRFIVTAAFEFDHPATVDDLVGRMIAGGASESDARSAVDDARTYVPENAGPTDLASIPSFLRWFENAYGSHTLAAIIHDRLIRDEPNSGVLRSDALADRFFRLMMQDAGIPWLKRWIMWAAVALRSRWAARGWRRLAIGAWLLLALTGIAAFINAVGAAAFDWPAPAPPVLLAAFSAVLPVASAPLWGRQAAASMVAAVAALWILPAAVFGLIGYGIYSVLESLTRRLGIE